MTEKAQSIPTIVDAEIQKLQKVFDSMTPEQRLERDSRRKQWEHEEHARKVQELRSAWNAPRRQLSKQEIDRTGPWGAKEAELTKMLGTGFLVALVGGRGSGKTQMGTELMKIVTTRLRSVYYNTLTGLFLELKATFKKDSLETEQDVVRNMVEPSFLVVDECGMKSDSEWENRIFFELIDRRYRAERDTLLIANYTKEQFLHSLGESLSSRMQETGGIIECNWESYRL